MQHLPTDHFHSRLATREELQRLTGNTSFLYNQRVWWEVVEDGLGFESIGIITEFDSAPIAMLVYFATRRGPFKLIGSPIRGSMTPYQRPIVFDKFNKDLYCGLLRSQTEFLRALGYSSISLGFDSSEPYLTHLASDVRGELVDRNSFIVEIEPDMEKMWAKMHSRQRNMVRKAQKNHVSVRLLQGSSGEIATFYDMLSKTFAKTGNFPPHPLRFYEYCVQRMRLANQLLFLSAEVEGRTIAMGLFLHDVKTMYFISATSAADVSQFAPNNLIQWEVMRLSVEKNLQAYDMCGQGIASIDKFKQSLGGRVSPQPWIVWRSPTAKIAESAYLKLNRFWARYRIRSTHTP